MMKRIFALTLCLILLAGVLAGCKSTSKDDKGAYIPMYLTDEVYDLDPANAYYNKDLTGILELLYEPLFTLSAKGKIQNALAQSYTVDTDEDGNVYMDITLKKTLWSNKYSLTADDCKFAWQRLLDPENGFPAASLLFDIKNARGYNQGIISKDHVGIQAVKERVIRIIFEQNVDVNSFLLNLSNVATAPLLSVAVSNNPDWAKKAGTIVTNGPFKLLKLNYEFREVTSFILERNSYYYRNTERDALNKYVLPYRILVDCSMSEEDLLKEYQNNHIFYVGSIPLSLRTNEYVQKNVQVTDTLSTFTCYLNENAEIKGQKIFADPHVRLALSLALDRQAIANAVVYASPATALVGPKVFEKGTSGSFRKSGGDLLATSAKMEEALAELEKVEIPGFYPEKYSFTIKVASYDEAQIQMAEMMAEAWEELGFTVRVKEIAPIENDDIWKGYDAKKPDKDVCDDLYTEAIQSGDFEVIVLDHASYAPTAYATLASFAVPFSGRGSEEIGEDLYQAIPHITGYNSERYNSLIEAVYYIPYFASMEENPDDSIFANKESNPNPYIGFGLETKEAYTALYQKIKGIYEEFGIQTTTKSAKWEEQKAKLLHEAEKVLMEEMPVIPVVFNKNASLTNKKYLSGVSSTYYSPAVFQKAKLKNHEDYLYVFYKFPTVTWGNYGMREEPTTAE